MINSEKLAAIKQIDNINVLYNIRAMTEGLLQRPDCQVEYRKQLQLELSIIDNRIQCLIKTE